MGWKIYFWFLSILLSIGYAVLFGVTPMSALPNIWDYLDLIFSSISLAGVFAYSYKKRLLSARFWKFWLVAFLLWDITYNLIISHYLGLAQQLGPEHGVTTFNEMLFAWLFFIPKYVALYLLGYKSTSLWNK
ncbi:MAG: hypothetical protein B7Y56_15980 [Gallionellales bacterium 35-53-114]|jgi:hypothetical protein|nr:MAG: hypothetical protein B7Y56_15980 [Gallionellales bacterium 35-53-114]HQS60035.1 hypothetical protein [Gallionellaceae bacterium]